MPGSHNKDGKDKKKPSKLSQIDEDPNGDLLQNVTDPLAEALKPLQTIQKFSPQRLDTHLLAFEVHIRRKKYLLVLRALKKSIAIDPNHPQVHRNKIRFFHKVLGTNGEGKELASAVKSVIEQESRLPELLGSLSLTEVNQNYINSHHNHLPSCVAGGEMLFLLDPSKKQEALNLLLDTSKTGVTIQEIISVHKILLEKFQDIESAEKYCQISHSLFPYATYFAPTHTTTTPTTTTPTTTTPMTTTPTTTTPVLNNINTQ